MIDISRLPLRPLVDSTILIAAWSNRRDADHQTCVDFLESMELADREMLVATPTIAELLRGSAIELPRRKSFVPVAFDQRAADILGRELPKSILQKVKEETGARYQYIKYDAMIAACARRYNATCIVSSDPHLPRLARPLSLTCVTPNELRLPLFRPRPEP
jgi:predicted nucleic acid-binding protein